MKSILVVGGSGGVGGEVVRQLLARGHRVRVSSRAPEKRTWTAGVEVFRGDLHEPATLRACAEGACAAFLYLQGDLRETARHLERAGVERITLLSSIDAGNDSAAAAYNRARHLKGEEGVAASGVPFTALRPGAFASNAFRFYLPQLAHGEVVRLPFPDSQQSPVDTRDLARVAVRALTTRELEGQRPVLTGPQSLSQRQQVATLAALLRRPLTVELISPAQARSALFAGVPPAYVELLLGQWEEETHRASIVTGEVERITGVAATTYENSLAWMLAQRERP